MNTTDEISEVINSLRTISGIGICYYDLNDFFNYGTFGKRTNKGHYCEFCERVRSLENGRTMCEKSDRSEAVELAGQYRTPFFFECHMGMRELVVPLIRNESLIGILFVGQCRTDDEDIKKSIARGAEKLGGDPSEFIELYNRLPTANREIFLAVGNILSQYFDMKIISNDLLAPLVEKSAKNSDSILKIRDYIDANYHGSITPSSIAKRFYLNPSYASRAFSERFGCTITDYISKVRIERAKFLLSSTNIPINSIALNLGFSDGNYFARVFRRLVGISPKQYRDDNYR